MPLWHLLNEKHLPAVSQAKVASTSKTTIFKGRDFDCPRLAGYKSRLAIPHHTTIPSTRFTTSTTMILATLFRLRDYTPRAPWIFAKISMQSSLVDVKHFNNEVLESLHTIHDVDHRKIHQGGHHANCCRQGNLCEREPDEGIQA